jgi:magnesium transporter
LATVLVDQSTHAGLKASADDIKQKLDSGSFVWVDLVRPDQKDVDTLVGGLGISDDTGTELVRMHQRPRLVNIEKKLAFLVLYGMPDKGHVPAEMHALIADNYVVTSHHGDIPGLDQCQVAHREHGVENTPSAPLVVVHSIIQSMADGYFPRLAKFDDQIDKLEQEIFDNPTDEQLQQLFAMKRELITLRKVVTPMRDMLGSIFTGVVQLPGFNADSSGWVRDAYDHMIHISDLIDSYRDLLTGAMDVYLSTVSNRLNAVMKQLTVIATIFLPLSFLTGFFGQNFGFLVNRIGTAWTFWVFAIGMEFALVAGMLFVFKRRKWL